MTASKIEWCDRSDWNPIRGCTRVSPGCGGPGPHGGCYAEAIAARFSDPGQAFHGFAERTKSGPRWTGKVELQEDRLSLPLRWRKSARIFVSSTSDVFHEALPDEAIDKIFAVMALAPQHTFQVLTKRADRMREYLTARNGMGAASICRAINMIPAGVGNRHGALEMPLPHCWLGVSVEDQTRADERIPHLLATPAAKRFISAEPLLGSIALSAIDVDGEHTINALRPDTAIEIWLNQWSPEATGMPLDQCITDWKDEGWAWPPATISNQAHLDWVIAGGESGQGARPMHPEWVRKLRGDCVVANVPFFFKQWGEFAPGISGQSLAPDGSSPGPARWNDPSTAWMQRVGRTAAGRLLDGREWSEFPA